MAIRVSKNTIRATGADAQALFNALANPPKERSASQHVRACRLCGCTEMQACPGGCWWVGEDLCSACADVGQQAK